MASGIDTLTIYQRLKSANIEDSAAKEIAEVFKDVTESNLATKTDITTLEKDIELARSDLEGDIEQLRSDLARDIEQLRSDLARDIEQLRSDLKKDLAQLKSELQKEIQVTKVDILKWVAGMLIAQAAFIAALVKLL